MRQRLSRFFDRLNVVRGEGRQVMLTRRAIKQQLRVQRPDCIGIEQTHSDLASNNQALRNLGRKALATILRA
ncbi:MAG: hypothetical protein AAB663_01220 [Patescibacteria group bacterium]